MLVTSSSINYDPLRLAYLLNFSPVQHVAARPRAEYPTVFVFPFLFKITLFTIICRINIIVFHYITRRYAVKKSFFFPPRRIRMVFFFYYFESTTRIFLQGLCLKTTWKTYRGAKYYCVHIKMIRNSRRILFIWCIFFPPASVGF